MEQLTLDLREPHFYYEGRPVRQIGMNFNQSYTWLDKRLTADKVSITISFMDGQTPRFKTILPEWVEDCKMWPKEKRGELNG